MFLLSQAWRTRSEEQKEAMFREHFDEMAALDERLGSLGSTVETTEDRWRKRGDGMRGEARRKPVAL